MEEGASRRSLSPYHEKCFPPYCESAQKVDKTVVSKMTRGDLEDKYILFADENLELKKQIRNHEQRIQRLQAAMARQEQLDKKAGRTPVSVAANYNQMELLEAQNKNLQAKVKVLKQQLMNHSYYHAKNAGIMERRSRDMKGVRDAVSSEFPVSQPNSAREPKPDKNSANLKKRVAELEEALEAQKKKYVSRINQLEKELATLEKEVSPSGTSVNEQMSEHSQKLNDNKELIKLKMMLQREKERGDGLEVEVDRLNRELEEAFAKARDLEMQLRAKPQDTFSTSSSHHPATIRALEEQIRDLKNENQTLKDTNEKLLELTQKKSEKSVKTVSFGEDKLQLQQRLQDMMEELNRKDRTIRDLEWRIRELEQQRGQPGECPRCEDLAKQLCEALKENQKLKMALDNAQSQPPPTVPSHSATIGGLQSEIDRLERENEELRSENDRLQADNDRKQREIERLKDDVERLREENDRLKNELDDNRQQINRMRPIVSEHQNVCANRKDPTPVPSHTGTISGLQANNSKLQRELDDALAELDELRPIVSEHKNICLNRPPTPTRAEECPNCEELSEQLCQALMENQRLKQALEEAQGKKAVPSVPSRAGEITDLRNQVERLTQENKRLKDQLDSQYNELDRLRAIAEQHALCPVKSTHSKPVTPVPSHGSSDEALREQNSRLEDQLAQALQELKVLRPIAEEHLGQCEQKQPGKAGPTPSPRQMTPVSSVKGRPDYQSRVSLPPSVHCAETVPLHDPAQKPNLVIVSQHDFEKVLMKKKKYQTDTEMMEPVEGKQVLNCKLEICMYDLEVDDSLIQYLKSLESEPKVYIDWDFVGLDQRTAPLPPDKALFYTNVIYFGPLSDEIKTYLRRSDMPVDLYLVRSSGSPLKVASGSLDMLPAMENPNRGFMRSIFLNGKNVPGRNDKPVGTIHCSFILHECCLGDPPFRDQLEVAVGTLHLKNRDGQVPDSATHIYVEYSLLGHCGPDLETDSVPRGEVMKFNHQKKLRVNDENAPHLKAMLNERNPKPLRFTILAEPCSLTDDTEVETVGYADLNLVEEMLHKDRDLVSCQVPVFANDGENLGTLSVTVLGIGTLQQYVQAEA